MTKDQTLSALGNQIDSFFSLQQVIDIVKSIEVKTIRSITTEDIAKAIENVVEDFEENNREVIDLDSAEFEICYQNKIELSNVRFDSQYIREVLENNFMDLGESKEE